MLLGRFYWEKVLIRLELWPIRPLLWARVRTIPLDSTVQAKYGVFAGWLAPRFRGRVSAGYTRRKIKIMSEGTIKRLTDKGFGFIETGSGKDMFFHNSNVEGTSFDQLREGDRVSFTEGEGPKGPRAENVRVL